LAHQALPPDDELARQLRGFGPLGVLIALLILAFSGIFNPLNGAVVLLWGWRSHTPWRELGFVRPKSWTLTIVVGIAFGIALKFAMKALVMPLLGADPLNQRYHYLAGNTAALPWAIVTLILGAGFGEEILFRGFLFERLRKLLGSRTLSKVLIVIITSALFAGAHYWDQGLPGVQQAAFTGLAFGTIFAVTGSIIFPMIAHTTFDLAALAMIYWNVEPQVAHLIFK
jgi:CAAX amino terminal protease family.